LYGYSPCNVYKYTVLWETVGEPLPQPRVLLRNLCPCPETSPEG
jgi:hypothetical protein